MKKCKKSGFFFIKYIAMISGFFAFLFVVEIKTAEFCLTTETFFFEPELRLETTANPHIHRDLTSCLQLKTIVFRRGVVSLSHVLWRTSYMTQQQGVHSTLALLLFVKLTRCGRKSFDWQLLVNNWGAKCCRCLLIPVCVLTLWLGKHLYFCRGTTNYTSTL